MTRASFKAEDSQTKALLKEFSLKIDGEDSIYNETEFLIQCQMKIFTDCMNQECRTHEEDCESRCILQSERIESNNILHQII